MDEIGPRGSDKLLWQLSRAFFRCACPNNTVFVERIACQGAFWVPWRFQALPGSSSRLAGCLCVPPGCPWCPWRPLAAPGAPWCPLAAPGGSCRFLAPPGCPWLPLAAPCAPWRLLAPPGCPWRLPLALPGWPSKFAFSLDSRVFSVIHARGWRSKFAFSLRFPSVFCDSSVWLALRICIFAAHP